MRCEMALAMEKKNQDLDKKNIWCKYWPVCAMSNDLRYDQKKHIEINYIAAPDRALEEQFFVILTFDKSE